MTTTDKVRENRARRAAERQGYALSKSRRRDPRASDYGELRLRSSAREVGPFADLGELERWLDADPETRPYTNADLVEWRAA